MFVLCTHLGVSCVLSFRKDIQILFQKNWTLKLSNAKRKMCPEFSFPLAKSHSERELKQHIMSLQNLTMLSTKLGLFCFVWQNEWETQRGITCYDVMQNPFPFPFQLFLIKKTSMDLVEVSKLNVFSRPQGDLHVYTMSFPRGEVYI